MSLLWTQAMPWWNKDLDYEYESDEDYPIRDPEETLQERGARYRQQVVDNHGVAPEDAQRAIQHVVGHLDGGHRWKAPTDYGFASNGDQRSHYSMHMTAKLMDPSTWEGKPVQDISTDEPIHASQNFIRPQSIAHNLFHKGQKETWDDNAVGDPDYNPEHYDDGDEEDEGDSTPEERALHDHARFVRRRNGRLEVADGHHRVGTDLLLGKPHTRGVIVHEDELR